MKSANTSRPFRTTKALQPTAVTLAAALMITLQSAAAQTNHVNLWADAPLIATLWPHVEPVLNARYPEITVTITAGQSGAHTDRLRPALIAGTGPDLFAIDAAPGRMGLLAEAGLLLPLEPYYEQFGWNEAFLPWAKEWTMYSAPGDGQPQTYGVPGNVDLIGVFYRETAFAELDLSVPETYEEFIGMLEHARDSDYLPLVGGFRDNTPRGWFISTIVQAAAGKDLIDDILAGNAEWTDPGIVLAATEAQRLANEGLLISQVHALGRDEGYQLFVNSPRALAHIVGAWMLPLCDAGNADCGFFPLPPIGDGLVPAYAGGLGGGFAIAADAGDPDAAAKVLEVLFSEEVQRSIHESAAQERIFVFPVTYDATDWDLNQNIRAVVDIVFDPTVDVGYNLSVVTPSTFVDEYFVSVQGLLIGQLTPEEFAARLQAAWEASGNEEP